MLAKALPVGLNQAVPVLGFLFAHFVKYFGRIGIRAAQAISIISIDASVLFLQTNCERQNLSLGKVFEVLRHPSAPGDPFQLANSLANSKLLPIVRGRMGNWQLKIGNFSMCGILSTLVKERLVHHHPV
jgi:hypothetical protein